MTYFHEHSLPFLSLNFILSDLAAFKVSNTFKQILFIYKCIFVLFVHLFVGLVHLFYLFVVSIDPAIPP